MSSTILENWPIRAFAVSFSFRNRSWRSFESIVEWSWK